jgi:hypothetical protein
MSRMRWSILVAAVVGFAGVQSAGAHHSFAAVFDATKPVSLAGTVVRFDFVNPHGWVTMDVTPPDAAVQRWRIEVANPNALLRLGWRKDSLKPGDHVTIDGFKARDGSNTAIGREFTLADGKKVLGGLAQELVTQ